MAAAAGSLICAAIPPMLISALAPTIAADLHLEVTTLGLMLSGFYLLAGLFSSLGGVIARRVGSAAALRIAAGCITLGLLAMSVAQNQTQLSILLAVTGLSTCLSQPACNDLLARHLNPRIRGPAFGIVVASVPFASLLAGAMLPVAVETDWRSVVAVVGGFLLLMQCLIPARHGAPAVKPTPDPALASPRTGTTLLATFLIGGVFLGSAAATAPMAFTATTGDLRGLDVRLVATAQILGSALCMAVRILGVTWAARLGATGRLRALGLIFGVSAIGMTVVAYGTSGAAFSIGIVVSLGFAWGYLGLFQLIVVDLWHDRVHTATGISMTGALLGAVVGPTVFPNLLRDNITPAWLLAGAAMLVGTSVLLVAAQLAAHSARR